MLISIDLAYQKGKKIVVAYFQDAFTRISNFNSLNDFIDVVPAFEYDYLVTEQFYYKKNINVFRKLTFMAGRLYQFCYEYGLEFVEIPPMVWKKSYLKGIAARTKKGNALLNKIALHITGRNNLTVDERDAVLMGDYYLRRIKTEKLMKGKKN